MRNCPLCRLSLWWMLRGRERLVPTFIRRINTRRRAKRIDALFQSAAEDYERMTPEEKEREDVLDWEFQNGTQQLLEGAGI